MPMRPVGESTPPSAPGFGRSVIKTPPSMPFVRVLASRATASPRKSSAPTSTVASLSMALATYTVLDYKKGQCNAHPIPSPAAREHEKAIVAEKTHLDLFNRPDPRRTSLWHERRTKVSNANYQRHGLGDGEEQTNGRYWLYSAVRDPATINLCRLGRPCCSDLTEWFAFLFDPNVPPTNNHAERMIPASSRHHTQSRRAATRDLQILWYTVCCRARMTTCIATR